MIYFAPAKINLGLQILERRTDGFHNLRSVMYPTGLCDIIEIGQQEKKNSFLHFTQTGLRVHSDNGKNLCIRAWELMASETELPGTAIHLHKQIPVGAGLGGGSSDASTVLTGLNQLAKSPVPHDRLAALAGQLGSDCPFFLHRGPMMMEGKGELLSPVDLSLHHLFLVLLFPEIHISTASAYLSLKPSMPDRHLRQLIGAPVDKWKGLIVNDFEKDAFVKYPLIKELKRALYDAGAMFASMSGSGSSLYGIFETPPDLPADIQQYMIWKGPA